MMNWFQWLRTRASRNWTVDGSEPSCTADTVVFHGLGKLQPFHIATTISYREDVMSSYVYVLL